MGSGRGGYREGAGRHYSWNHGETKSVRIPIALADRVVEIAKKLDRQEVIDYDTNSIDLSKVKVYKLHGRDVVRLEDLRQLGVNIAPKLLK